MLVFSFFQLYLVMQIHTASAKYIMKCDDDTFVRIDSVMKEVKKIPSDASLYVGNINYYHKPQRTGKWAVTHEVYFASSIELTCDILLCLCRLINEKDRDLILVPIAFSESC